MEKKTTSVIVTHIEPGKIFATDLKKDGDIIIYDEAASAYLPGAILMIDKVSKQIIDDIDDYPYF